MLRQESSIHSHVGLQNILNQDYWAMVGEGILTKDQWGSVTGLQKNKHALFSTAIGSKHIG